MKEITDKDVFSNENKSQVYQHFMQIGEKADLVTLGCPHFSLDDLNLVYRSFDNRNLKENVDFWIFISKTLAETEEIKKIIFALENKGVRVFTDTCMVVSPGVRFNYKNVLTNSAKAAFYLTQDGKIQVNLASIEEIVESVSI